MSFLHILKKVYDDHQTVPLLSETRIPVGYCDRQRLNRDVSGQVLNASSRRSDYEACNWVDWYCMKKSYPYRIEVRNNRHSITK